MSWLKNISFGDSVSQKVVLAFGACAVAGMAAVQLTRALSSWRDENIDFDFPIEEELFIGWGGCDPRQVKRSV